MKLFGEGLRYMQLDVDFIENDKIDIMMEEYQHAGILFCVFMYLRVFKENYFWLQEDRKVNQFCKNWLKLPREKYDEMLLFAIKIKIFDRGLFEQYNIVTSRGIQKRYLVITKKWSKVQMIKEFILEDVDTYSYQLVFKTKEGHYIGYTNRNSNEIFNDDFVPRKHVAKPNADENRTDLDTKSIPEQHHPPRSHIPEKSMSLYNPHKMVGNEQTINYFQGEQIFKDVCAYYGFTEINFPNQRMLLGTFLRVMDENKRLEFFKTQFYAYRNYKTSSGGTKHGFENFIGHQSTKFDDGIWQTENWEDKLSEVINFNKKKNGTQSKRATPSGDFSSKF